MSTAHIWPFPVGTQPPGACMSCPDEPANGSEYCREHRGDDPDYEPTDMELAQHGIHTEPTDPWDSPSYTTLNDSTQKETTQ